MADKTELQQEKQNIEEPKKRRYDWLKGYQWQKGQSGNPNGRPKGKTLKEFAREYLESLPDEEKIAFLSALPEDIVWRMAEGNPAEDKKVTVSVPKPILGGLTQGEKPLEVEAIEQELLDEGKNSE